MSTFISIESISKEEFCRLLEDTLDAKLKQYGASDKPEYLTVQQISKILAVTELTVYNYIKRGLIKSLKIGRRHMIERSSFHESLAEVKSFKYKRNGSM
ncbi:helix-turn-helix domain-containing protein [Altibacter sp. HG106]|uniref:helix-turn-helix domain-containing protein n=1 Tax=Altibacter sp. HG106 TaxID=3023937 RepID=UPI0023508ECB|nr:helix-turn-helix domain-containing protein [Altibacter sp. HG106]MDC7995506.1 helix-turn-helix domain-containing protein [Altibacter sp. HG106]